MRLSLLRAAQDGSTLFRNNVAQGVVGNTVLWIKREQSVRLFPGDVVIRNGRVLHAGLCDGSSDLIGWTPVEIAERHVGLTLGVFTAVEEKAKGKKPTAGQQNFIDQVNKAGGIGGVSYGPLDTAQLIKKYA